jgi:hypothetical protein
MPTGVDLFVSGSHELVAAGRVLEDGLSDPDAGREGTVGLLEAASENSPRMQEGSGAPAPAGEDQLAEILLELQLANMLLSAAVAVNEHGNGTDGGLLAKSINDTDATLGRVEASIAPDRARWEAEKEPSPDLDAAIVRFRLSAIRALNSIVDATAGVIDTVAENMRKLDGGPVLEAIGNLGRRFAASGALGPLARAGFEKLASAFDSLLSLISSDSLEGLRDQLREIWGKMEKREYSRSFLRWLIGAAKAEDRVDEIAKMDGLDRQRLDATS